MAMPKFPAGTVTLFFTDIERSTALLEELGESYIDVLAGHRRTLRQAVARHGGVEVDTHGDAFFVAFARAADAVAAARDVQRDLAETRVRVRIGIHTGEPLVTEEGYVGVDVHRAARIAAAGHGGQVLLSQTTRDLLDGELEVRDLGEHRLKDLSAPQRLYQLGSGDFPPLETLHQANLPVQPTPIVGRERELDEAAELLRRHRLLTLVGPGGSGKTRLALQLAADAAEAFENGVWWVPLAPLADADLVLPAIAQAVGAKQAVADHLRAKHALLLVDNFEHLLAGAPRITELLREAPNIKVLVTSRAPLHLAGEQEYPVPPLAGSEAVALFTERARAVKPGFEADEHVRRICDRLDGLPLAVELAAARVRVLPPAQLAQRLDGALALLTAGARDAPERQRTLRATIEWSHDLLTSEEKQVFARLAVFAGSFSIEAAEQVCEATVDLLQGLVEKNLVRESEPGRFFLLDTIREFASEQLDASTEAETLGRRHADFFLNVAQAAEPRMQQADVLAALSRDEANFRAALAYAREHSLDLMLQLVGLLWRAWYYRGQYEEGRSWLEQALSRAGTERSLARAHALRGLAAFLVSPDVADRARALLEEAIELHREHEDDAGLSRCLNNLGVLLASTEDPDLDRATELLQEALAVSKELERRGQAFPDLARPLGNLASIALRRGDLAEARRLANEELEIARAERDDFSIAVAHGTLAWLATLEGNDEEAARFLRPSLQFSREIADRWPASALGVAAVIGARHGRRTEAARLFGALEAHRDRLGLPGLDAPIDRVIATTTQALNEAGFGWALAEGRDLSFEELVDLALEATTLSTEAEHAP